METREQPTQEVLVTDLRPGDVWHGDKDDVAIIAVEFREDTSEWPEGRVRIQGRITRGWGAGNKLRWWSFHPDQTLQIVRPG